MVTPHTSPFAEQVLLVLKLYVDFPFCSCLPWSALASDLGIQANIHEYSAVMPTINVLPRIARCTATMCKPTSPAVLMAPETHATRAITAVWTPQARLGAAPKEWI